MPHTFFLFSVIFALNIGLHSQSLYFPPISSNEWETITPAQLGWDESKIPALFDFLEQQNSKGFMVLKDGKIVIEKYFGDFNSSSVWYWASAGKTVTAFLLLIAQERGFLNIDSPSNKYLGVGFTTLNPLKENLITIRNQLTMTSGLDDNVADPFCTLPECLVYKSDAGNRWAYHNAPYTLLDKVLFNATGEAFNTFFTQNLRNRTGMSGLFVQQGYNNVLFSNMRSFARFGLLILNKGVWANDTLLKNRQVFNEMINTSNNLNKSYGFLWWLNGKESHMLPETQFVFPGYLFPDAPASTIAALGKNGQIINVVESENLIVVRIGEVPGTPLPIATVLNNDIWKRLNSVINPLSSINEEINEENNFTIYPTPNFGIVNIKTELREFSIAVFNIQGEEVFSGKDLTQFQLKEPSGIYFAVIKSTNLYKRVKFVLFNK